MAVDRAKIAKAGGAAGGLSGVAAVLFLVAQQLGYLTPTAPAPAHDCGVAALEKRFDDHLEVDAAWKANIESGQAAQWRRINGGE